MSKPKASACAQLGVRLIQNSVILYSDTDCQGFMEKIIWEAGASKSEMPNYAGSNDMIRHACSWVGTIAEAKKLGYLVPGAALFIVEQNGNEPSKYRGDGVGNASHVGMYIGDQYAFVDEWLNKTYKKSGKYNVIHSSASRGRACGSTLKNAWTHVGLWKAVDYSEYGIGAAASKTVAAPAKQSVQTDGGEHKMETRYVYAESGSDVNMRKNAGTSYALVARVPVHDAVQAEDMGNGWSKVEWNGHTGYMMTQFLVAERKEQQPDNEHPKKEEQLTFQSLENKATLNQAIALITQLQAALIKLRDAM